MAESARADLAQGTVTRRRDQPIEHRLTHDRPLDPAAMAAYLQQTTGNHSLNQLVEEREEHAGLEQALSADPQDRSGLVRQRLDQVPAELHDPIVNALKPRFPDAKWLAESRAGNATGNAAAAGGGAVPPVALESAPASSDSAAGAKESHSPDEAAGDQAADVGQGLSKLGEFAVPPPPPQTPPPAGPAAATSSSAAPGGQSVAATGASPATGAQAAPTGAGGTKGAGAAGPSAAGLKSGGQPGAGAAAGGQQGKGGQAGASAAAGKAGPTSQSDKAGAAKGGAAAGADGELASASTASLALVDFELAEHQRWGTASSTVGAAGSEQRAEFVTEQVGAGLLGGFKEGGEQGLALGLVESFSPIPGVGAIIGGVQALEGLKGQAHHAAEAVHNFGEGSDTYEVLANSIAAVSAVIDVVTGVLGVFNGILGVIEVALWAITAGAAVAAIVTAGATAAIAVMAGEAAEVVTEIKEVVGIVMLALSAINSVVLQPVVLLFRAMHTMTSQADPRAVEAQGAGLKQSAGAVGGFLGGLAGAAVAGAIAPEEEGAPPKVVEEEAPPPAPATEGPTVTFEEPTPGSGTPTATDQPASTPGTPTPEVAPDAAPIVPDKIISIDENPVPTEVETPVPTEADTPTGGGGGGDEGGGAGGGGSDDNAAHNQADFERLKAQYAMEEIMGAEPVGSATKGGSGDVRSNQVLQQVEVTLPDGSTKMVSKPVEGVRNVSMDVDVNHSAPIFEQPRIAEDGRVFPLRGQDGEWKNLTQMPGEVNGQPGIHEYIVDQHGNLVHQQFIPGGSVTGEPGGRPPRPATPGSSGEPPTGGGGGPAGGGGPEVPTPTDGGPSVDSASTPAPSDTPAPPVTNDTPPTTDTAPAPGSGDQLNAADASVRNSRPLTSDEFNTFSQQAQQMGMPADQIHQVQGPTAYGPTFDQLTIGPDVKPLPPDLRPPDLANPANAAMGPTEVLSHEIIGHREAAQAGQEHSLPWAEEAQASFRAGLHGDLTPEQRQNLIQDGASRFRYQDPEKPGTVYMYMDRPAPQGGAPGGGGSGAGGGGGGASEPKVILSPEIQADIAAAGGKPARGSTGQAGAAGGTLGVIGPAAAAGAAAGQAQAGAGAGGAPKASVEPVNPKYQPPPGTPQQLKQMQDDISRTLADRAKAEEAKARMDAELAKHQSNTAPAQQAVQGAQEGITATQAHQQDVALRDQANKQQQAKQQESQSTVGSYADKAAGLATLSVPLAAFRGFTSLASHLPGDAGAAMAKMNADGQKVTEAFEQMGVKMAEQATGLPARQQELQSDNTRIQASGQQGQAATADLQQAQQGALAFQQANTAKIQQATAGKAQAAGQENKLEASAKNKTQKATTLAEQLQSWATEHKAARQQAVDKTKQQLQAKGKVVTAVKDD